MSQTKAELIDAKGDANFDSGTLYVDAVNNRVAVGTTSPSAILHVREDSATSSVLRLENREASGGVATQAFSIQGVFDYDNGASAANGGRIVFGKEDTYTTSLSAVDSYLAFQTVENNTQSEKARIDSSGRLLVGTTSTTGITSIVAQGNSTNSAGAGVLGLGRGTGTISSGNQLGIIDFTDNAYNIYARIEGVADAATGSGDYPGRLVFSTTADGAGSPTEWMRISNGGHIYIIEGATYAANYNGGSNGGFRWRAPTQEANTQMEGYSTSTSTSRHMLFSNPNGVVGAITTAASATTYATSSDYRLKENVIPVTDGITRLLQLKPSRFNFIADPDTIVDGFIAHEAQAVVPECVTGEKDEVDDEGNPVYQGIDQSKLVPLLTAALQEAIGEIESLKARLTTAGI